MTGAPVHWVCLTNPEDTVDVMYLMLRMLLLVGPPSPVAAEQSR